MNRQNRKAESLRFSPLPLIDAALKEGDQGLVGFIHGSEPVVQFKKDMILFVRLVMLLRILLVGELVPAYFHQRGRLLIIFSLYQKIHVPHHTERRVWVIH